MSVSETAKQLAEAIIAARQVLSPRQRLLLELFRLMPLYLQIHDLAAWDAAYHGAFAAEDGVSELGLLIGDVYDFASDPFYGAFQPALTLQVYTAIVPRLRGAGVSCPNIHEFTAL